MINNIENIYFVINKNNLLKYENFVELGLLEIGIKKNNNNKILMITIIIIFLIIMIR